MADHLTAGHFIREYRRQASAWLKGDLLEQAIVRTLARFNRPLDWAELVTEGALGTCSTGFDRNSAIAALVGRGEVVTEEIPHPDRPLIDVITIYSLPASPTQEGTSL